ncbi:hypothetical protein [Caulobacter mirabilis]|uniref:Uncharacterized protein n=1 Tax=Caulobacter mirabilis TaxID=69666 RepID=A0A2D2AX68_9CAUL|nr:hypothetical protein [Caulobacter mirabilis]ATQ42592.1 hypothetical protein CSW64_09330 [Caulobacter mirabilis]
MSRAADPRLSAADVAAVLDRFGGHDLLARGSVTVISLAAIRDRTGDRWPRRRADVWAYVERRLDEHLTFQDLAQRIGETDYLIAMTSEDGLAAQAVALKVLEEVLMHFLGEANPRDLKVTMVADLRGDEVLCTPLDPLALRRSRPVPRPAASAAPVAAKPAPPAVDPIEEKRRNPYVFRTGSGLSLRIDFAVETLVSLRHGVPAALRIEPTVTETRTGRVIPARAFARLSDADLATIDQATLDYAALYLPTVEGANAQALIAPVTFRTMAASKGRQALMATAPHELLKARLVIELVDAGDGAPAGRLIEVTGLLRTVCRGVFARVQPGPGDISHLRGARLIGVTLDAGDLPADESRQAAQMLDFGKQARGLAPTLAVQGLGAAVMFDVAKTAGLTHAALRSAPVTAATPALAS